MNVHIPTPVDTDWQTVKVPRKVFCRITTEATQLAALLDIMYGDIEDIFDKTEQRGDLAELVVPQNWFDRTLTAYGHLAVMADKLQDSLVDIELREVGE